MPQAAERQTGTKSWSRLTQFKEPGKAGPTVILAQFAQTARLDLANAFARHAVNVCDLVQRVRPTIPQTKAQLDHFSIARRQRTQDLGQALPQQELINRHGRIGGPGVTQEVL